MAYTKTNWTTETPINTTNLNKIENGIETANTVATSNNNGLMSASDKAAFDKIAPTERLEYPDLNDLTGNYMVYCLNAYNGPNGETGNYGFLIQIQMPGQAYKKQLFSIFDNDNWFKRSCNNGTWTNWSQL